MGYKPLALDEEQRQAVTSSGSTLVVAGPGAGKTRVLLGRALHLLEGGLPPERIFLLTFTVRTRNELRERLSALGVSGIKVETFHALAYDLIYEATGSPPRLIPEEESEAVVRKLLKGHGLRLSPRRALERIYAGEEDLLPLRREYFAYLERNDLFDYYRLLSSACELVKRDFAGHHLLIDEYQDLSPEILRFLTLFSRAAFFLAGDPAQAIYGFRGANPERLRAFLQEFLPDLRIRPLRRSYRVPERILEVAEGLREDPFGFGLTLSAVRSGGEIRGLRFATERSEAIGVAKEVARLLGGVYLETSGQSRLSPGDILVLARLRALLSPIKETLLREGIPVAEPEERAEEERRKLRELAERLSAGTISAETLRQELDRLSPHLKSLLEEPGMERERLAARLRLVSTAELISASREGVNLLTVHGAKGLEAEAVILAGAEEGLFPLTVFPDADPAEEKRLLYVALTRARNTFVFTLSRTRTLFGKRLSGKVSPWLKGLPLKEEKPRPKRPAQGSLFALLALLFLLLLWSLPARAESLTKLLETWTPVLLKKHPALSALSVRIRAGEKRVAPAGALPDPTVSFVVRNVGDPVPANSLGEEPMSLTGIRIEQGLPWKGKRRARQEMAALRTEILRVKYRERVWELWRDLVATVLEAAYLEEEARILREMEGLLTSLETSARAKYESGGGLQADVFKAATERSLLKERIKQNLERRLIVRHRLARRLLFTEIPALPEIELPERLPALPDRSFLNAILDQAPRVAIYKLTLRQKEISARLASLERFPDFKIFAGWYSRGNLPELYELGVGFNLPLFISRKQGPLWEAEKEEVLSAERTLEDVKAELRYRLEEYLTRAETEAELLELYKREILPQAEADYRSAQYYYGTGALDFLNVLERLRRLLNHRLNLVRHRVNYLAALAGMQALLGRTLTEVLPGPEGGAP